LASISLDWPKIVAKVCALRKVLILTSWFYSTVYDVSNRDSFNDLQTWFNELDTYCSSKEVVRMIVGNKVDKVRTNPKHRQEFFDMTLVSVRLTT
jgi:hypothetical protein